MLIDSVGAALVLGIGGGRCVPERDTSFRTVLVGIGLSGDTGYEGIEHHACQTGVRGDEGVRERGLSLRVFCAFRMSWHAQSGVQRRNVAVLGDIRCVAYVWVCVMWCYGPWIGRDDCRSARNVCRGIHECGHGRIRKSDAAFPASVVRGGRWGQILHDSSAALCRSGHRIRGGAVSSIFPSALRVPSIPWTYAQGGRSDRRVGQETMI